MRTLHDIDFNEKHIMVKNIIALYKLWFAVFVKSAFIYSIVVVVLKDNFMFKLKSFA